MLNSDDSVLVSNETLVPEMYILLNRIAAFQPNLVPGQFEQCVHTLKTHARGFRDLKPGSKTANDCNYCKHPERAFG